MRALITGVNGFVGKHLANHLKNNGYEVFGCDVSINPESNITVVDLLNSAEISNFIREVKPLHIYHLAGISNVSYSWENLAYTFDVNVKGTLNLLDAVIMHAKDAKVLFIGSGDEYGIVRAENIPIGENTALNPANPYSLSKYTAEKLGLMYHTVYGLNIVCVRAFNHIGAGQGNGFVIPDFCSQIVDIERGKASEILIGNLEAVRDFSDVRDIVGGYMLLMEKGHIGEVYNIGSGKGHSIQSMLDILISLSTANITVRVDEKKLRPSDTPVVICDNTKINLHTGYEPKHPIEETIKETLEFWRQK